MKRWLYLAKEVWMLQCCNQHCWEVPLESAGFSYFCQSLLDMTTTIILSTQHSWSYHQRDTKQTSTQDTAHTFQTVSQWNVLSWYSRQLPAYKINYTNINSNTEKGCTIINHKITIFACQRQHILVCFLTPCICLYIAHCMVQES
jgi:hypothetical protein